MFASVFAGGSSLSVGRFSSTNRGIEGAPLANTGRGSATNVEGIVQPLNIGRTADGSGRSEGTTDEVDGNDASAVPADVVAGKAAATADDNVFKIYFSFVYVDCGYHPHGFQHKNFDLLCIDLPIMVRFQFQLELICN